MMSRPCKGREELKIACQKEISFFAKTEVVCPKENKGFPLFLNGVSSLRRGL